MKGSVRRKFDYLIYSLGEELDADWNSSEDPFFNLKFEKGSNSSIHTDSARNYKKEGFKERMKGVILGFLAIVFWLIPLLIQLIFLIPLNIFLFIRAKFEGIPFRYVPPVIGMAYMVDRIGDLKIVIYHNEHPPPHFHVVSSQLNFSMEIETGRMLRGEFPNKRIRRKIESWHSKNKNLLIRVWNETRPTNCKVGPIR